MTRTAVIAALPGELATLVRGWTHKRSSGTDLWHRSHPGGEWIGACAGMGAEAALRAAAEAENRGRIDLWISAGWAGSLRPHFVAGKAYLVASVLDAETGDRFRALTPAGCTLATCRHVAGPAEKRGLAEHLGADLVDMEGAHVARLAAARAAPFICVKAVSDAPGEQLPDFERFVFRGKLRLGPFAGWLLLRPSLWPAMGRLGRNSRRAAEALGQSLLAILRERQTLEGRLGAGAEGSPQP